PTYNQIVADGTPFTVYGIPVILTSYASNFIPMIMITWVQSYVEKFIEKIVPASLKVVLVPSLTVLVMLPLMFCALGPIGNIIGQGIAAAMVWTHETLGFVSTALVGGLWILLIATGMHQALIAIALGQMANPAIGYDDSIMVGALIAVTALYGVELAYAIRAKDAEVRSTGITYFITAFLGGIGEPGIFGILLKYTPALVYNMIGGFVGGAVAGILGAKVYFFSGLGNVFMMLGFAGADPHSLFAGCAGGLAAFGVALALGIMGGFGEDSKPLSKKAA
ncbi:MAG: PTS transporter subunit EIIC, partial [Atopobiaceae bacterium]|nr:PTS transporter subunit EIIC [Atopobiaceae bacterium]